MLEAENNRWVEIDLEAIKHNLISVRTRLNQGVKVLGVVKGDAYGHGAIGVARLLEAEGIDMLGVTTLEEGLELRNAGIKVPILIFSPLLPHEIEIAILNDLRVSISHEKMARWLIKSVERLGTKTYVHLKIETGMGRTGLWPRDVIGITKILASNKLVEVEGIYSHLATAMWKDKKYARQQFSIFQSVVNNFIQEGINIPLKHISNSAGILDLPDFNLDMVRVGTLLYGQLPSNEVIGKLELRDPWKLKAKVIYLHHLPKGYSIGYSRTYTAKRNSIIATVPMGFVDGIQVEPVGKPANILEVLKVAIKSLLLFLGHKRMIPVARYKGYRLPFVGKVGMQLTMLDATDCPELQVGDIVELPARRTSVNAKIPKVYNVYKPVYGGEKL